MEENNCTHDKILRRKTSCLFILQLLLIKLLLIQIMQQSAMVYYSKFFGKHRGLSLVFSEKNK